jgi:hypothetical protein
MASIVLKERNGVVCSVSFELQQLGQLAVALSEVLL